MKRTYVIVTTVLGLVCALFIWRQGAPTGSPQTRSSENNTSAGIGVPANTMPAQRAALMRPTRVPPGTNEAVAPTTNLLTRLLKGDGHPPHISHEQAETFASAHGRRADALLAAWQASGDVAFLREAMGKFPNDPQVAYMAWCRSGAAEDPAEAAKAKGE